MNLVMRSDNNLGIAKKISLRQRVEVHSTHCEMKECGQIQNIQSGATIHISQK